VVVEEGGARVCRMPKLPLKHDARTPPPPSQTVRLQLTLPPIPVPGCLTPARARGLSRRGWPASSKSPCRTSELWNSFDNIGYGVPGTRGRSHVTTSPPLSFVALLLSSPPPSDPVAARSVDQYAVEVMWCRPILSVFRFFSRPTRP